MSDAVQTTGANAPDATILREMLASYWRVEDEKNSKRQAHRQQIGELSEQQAEAKSRAKDAGHPIAVFNALVMDEKARRAATAREAKLDEDERDHLAFVKDKLGLLADTPLGRAALGEDAQEPDDRPGFLKDKEKSRRARKAEQNEALDAVADNGASTIADGIRPLHS